MDFRFTDDQQDLIDAAKAVLIGEVTSERLRSIVEEADVTDLWPQFSELGLLGFMAPVDQGGLGQTLGAMAAVAEWAGYVALPEPLVETAGIVVPGHIEAGIDVDSVITGQERISVQSDLRPYIDGADLSHAFLCADDLVAADQATLTAVKSIDPLRQIFKVSPTGNGSDQAKYHGAVLSAAQLVGLSQRMLDMSTEYAKDRHQFGKPIGSFQAIKHQLANVYTQIDFTRPMIHLAAVKGGAAVHNAKVAAIDTAMLAAETAIQVHGGMGYTFEVDLHLFMKRAWALCGEWGDRNYHMKKLENYVLADEAKLGPGQTFS